MSGHCWACGETAEDCCCVGDLPSDKTSPPVKTVEAEGLRLGTYQSIWTMMGFDARLDDHVAPLDSTVMNKMLEVYRSLCLGH